MLVRGDSLARSMSAYLIREIGATPSIMVRLQTEVTDGHGTDHVDTLILHDKLNDRTEQIPAAALFVLIGGGPYTSWLPETIRPDHGYILTGRDIPRGGAPTSPWAPDPAPQPPQTSMPGGFGAGDARYRSIKRVASAVGDGASAVRLAQEYLAAEDFASAVG